jgi:hypothetical protein
MYLRCMEHSLHVAVKHFVEKLAPHSRKKANVGSDNEDAGEDSNTDDNDDLEPGDSLGKALALVKQVSSLPFY